MNFSLPAFSMRRPVTVTMLSLTMLGLGAIAWYLIPVKFLPEASPPFINCQIPYPGASPQQVEQEVAIPAEGEFRTISGLELIRTISDSNGCFVHMQFSLDTDMNVAVAEIRDRMERLKLVLPPEIDRMLLQRFNSRSIPVVAFGLFSAGDQDEFIHLVRTLLEPRLRRVEGVADVIIYTTKPESEVLVEFDQDRLRSLNLGIYDVVNALQQSSFNLTVGELFDSTEKSFVRVVDDFRRIEDIEDQIVTPNGLRLRDLATVRYAAREEGAHVAIDGKGGAFILVIKESEANTVDTAEAVLRLIKEELPQDPLFKEAQHYVFFDQASLINSALGNLYKSGQYGAVMAIIILFLFMHRVRPTLIVAFAIPSSIVVALVSMFFLDMTLNLVTMVSMIIGVGLLVDNAIVVVENIIRYRQLGLSPRDSAERGASEVGLAIFASTATTWVVFVPLFYMDTGRMSVFMRELAVPMATSLFGSLVIALTIIPLAMSRIRDWEHSFALRMLRQAGLVRPADTAPRMTLLQRFEKYHPIRHVIDVYRRLLAFTLQWRVGVLTLLGLLLGITWYVPFSNVQMKDIPKLDTREIKVEVELDQNFDMEMARKTFDALAATIEPYREEWGIRNIFTLYTADGGDLTIYLYTTDDGPEWNYPPYTTEEILEKVKTLIPERTPGVLMAAAISDADESGGERGISLRMRGNNRQELEEYAEQFKVVMRQMDLLTSVTTDLQESEEEMQLRIDAPLAERQGVSPMMLAQTVDIALRGARLPYMKSGGREIPVWGQFREEDRRRKENLETIAVPTLAGGLVPINQIAGFNRAPSPDAIQRVNGKNVITLYAQTEDERLTDIQKELQRRADNFKMPLGYTIEFGDQLSEIIENFANFSAALWMAVILIYLVMAALFESVVLPLSILTTVPLAFVGVYWTLFVTGSSLEVVTLIGCILMVGLIVNNGIVIVDHMNQLRAKGVPRNEAVVQAGIDRFRPVMMTALTTILGCVPLALATTGGAATFNGLGRAIVGGLSAGTLLTLFIVPLFYVMLDDLGIWTKNFLGGLGLVRKKSENGRQPV